MGSAAGGAAPGSAFSPPPSGLWDLPKSDRFWHKLECILFCINAWGRWSTLWSLGLGAAKLYSSVSRNTFPRLETAMTLSQLVRTLLCYLSVMLEITSASPVIAPFFFFPTLRTCLAYVWMIIACAGGDDSQALEPHHFKLRLLNSQRTHSTLWTTAGVMSFLNSKAIYKLQQ